MNRVQDKSGRQELAKFLKDGREAVGLSQIEVSQKMGYTSPQFVSNWERGLAKPPLSALSKLIKLYGVNSEEILDRYVLTTKRALEKVFFKSKAQR